MIRGQFVVVLPYYGGWSPRRIRRAAFQAFVDTAISADVTLMGEPSYRLDRTRKGLFLVVEAPANTHREAESVRADAQYMSYAHRDACPHLSAWIDQHIQEAAA